MMVWLGTLDYRWRWAVLLTGALFVLAGGIYGHNAPEFFSQDPGFQDPARESHQAITALREEMGADESPVLVLFSARPGTGHPAHVEDPAFREEVERVLAEVGSNPDVRSVYSAWSTGKSQFHALDGSESYAIVNLSYGSDSGTAGFERLKVSLTSDLLRIRLGGELATQSDIRKQLQEDLLKAELVSFPALAILLVLVFRSLVAALLPLAIGSVAISGSMAAVKLLTHVTEISVYAANIVTMLGLGLAIDYSLFIVSRFREELSAGKDTGAAIVTTVATAGRTVVFSGFTVMVSLLSLVLLPQNFFLSMAFAGSIAVLLAVVSAVTLLPAVLGILGPRVNAWSLGLSRSRSQKHPAAGPESGRRSPATESSQDGWYRFTRRVMARAPAVCLLSLVFLVMLGLPFLRVQVGFSDTNALPAGTDSRDVFEVITSDRFPRGAVETVFISLQTEGPVTRADNIAALHRYVEAVRTLEGVAAVESLVSLDSTLTLEDYQQLYADPDEMPMASEALQFFARGEYTRVLVSYSFSHHSEASRDLVRSLRAIPRDAALKRALVGGHPAYHIDFINSLKDGMPAVFLAIAASMMVVLFFMLGSILVPIKAILLNILSLSASFGALVWIFQDGRLTDLLDFQPLGALDGSILVLVFAIAFGLSMDYEVFLLSRIKEQYDLTGDTTEAVAVGVQKTGSIITSAALLIAVVFMAFSLGRVVILKEIGIGLFIAVVVDATVIRLMLVPATMVLLGRWNWWLPGPLQRVYRWAGLAE